MLFICYRSEARDATTRFKEILVGEFSEGFVYHDVDRVDLGEDWRLEVEKAASRCDAVLVVIDRQWLRTDGAPDHNRLLEDGDAVQFELEIFKKYSRRFYPVLLEGADMPLASELPEELRWLAPIHATTISSERFDRDARDVASDIARQHLDRGALLLWQGRRFLRSARGIAMASVAGLVALVVLALLLRKPEMPLGDFLDALARSREQEKVALEANLPQWIRSMTRRLPIELGDMGVELPPRVPLDTDLGYDADDPRDAYESIAAAASRLRWFRDDAAVPSPYAGEETHVLPAATEEELARYDRTRKAAEEIITDEVLVRLRRLPERRDELKKYRSPDGHLLDGFGGDTLFDWIQRLEGETRRDRLAPAALESLGAELQEGDSPLRQVIRRFVKGLMKKDDTILIIALRLDPNHRKYRRLLDDVATTAAEDIVDMWDAGAKRIDLFLYWSYQVAME